MSINVLSSRSLTWANTKVVELIIIKTLLFIESVRSYDFKQLSQTATMLFSGVNNSCVTFEVKRLSKFIFYSDYDN